MPQNPASRKGAPSAPIVAGGLGLVALVLLAEPFAFRSPVGEPAVLPSWITDTRPVRQPTPRPEYQSGVFAYQCNECHRIIPPTGAEAIRSVMQHREILLKHGINTWCLSCHHPANRNAFVGDRGEEIAWNTPQLLCARCHGTVYRDWQHGAHGRTNGFWDVSRGEQTRLKCIECHDPHQPPFPPMRPAPGPHTLRMGPRDLDHGLVRDNPLRLPASDSHGQSRVTSTEEDD